MMERIIEFTPGYDKRESGCGIGGMTLGFVLKGDKGAVRLSLFTDWYPESVQEEKPRRLMGIQPMGGYVGYHSPVPLCEGQEPSRVDCPYIGKPCYGGGSYLLADDIRDRFLAEGDTGVWAELEAYYTRMFEAEGDPSSLDVA